MTPTLHVCITCRGEGRADEDLQLRPGRLLFEAVTALNEQAEAPVRVKPIECLMGCERGCTAALSAPGKWRVLLGHLTPAVADDLLAFTSAYRASRSGAVLPSKRPPSLSKAIIGRFPADPEEDNA